MAIINLGIIFVHGQSKMKMISEFGCLTFLKRKPDGAPTKLI
jgi:hypothetical protein